MPWKDIYVQDNERYETFEQATEIHKYLTKWYTRFNYELIKVPQSTVENRVDFILNNI
jgi:predicted ATPase